MEEISHLVSSSFARHGFATQLDHRRLQWSKWSRCESSFSVLPVPCKPGLFAIAEEIPAGGSSTHDESRALALLGISETEDLAMSLCRLFLPGAPERELLAKKHCYTRYAIIEDDDQRHTSYRSLRESMASPSARTELCSNLTAHTFAKELQSKDHQSSEDTEKASPLARTGT